MLRLFSVVFTLSMLFCLQVTRRTLEHSLELDVTKKVVVIPKLPLQDYSSYRGENQGSSKQHSTVGAVDCLRALVPYLSRPQKQALLNMLADPQHLTVRFRNLNFKCRIFRKLDLTEIYAGTGTAKRSGTAGIHSASPER
jgi:hypothetical protein